MAHDPTFDELWETAPPATATFDPDQVRGLTGAARRYLTHALRPGAKIATAVRLRMHGTIRLGTAWEAFEAEQVMRWDRGFVWRARTHMKSLPVRGFDRWLDGEGAMKWKLFGLVPVMTASGADVTRSAAGRLHAESIWLPGALLGDGVSWSEHDAEHPEVTVHAHGEDSRLELVTGPEGALREIRLARWGNPGGGPAHYEDFGGIVEGEGTFDGVTVPTRVRIGWYFGSPRFEDEGEFFRATVDAVEYR